jgi:hypothetical protein
VANPGVRVRFSVATNEVNVVAHFELLVRDVAVKIDIFVLNVVIVTHRTQSVSPDANVKPT